MMGGCWAKLRVNVVEAMDREGTANPSYYLAGRKGWGGWEGGA